MKNLKIISALTILMFSSIGSFAIGNNKTLMVDYFGSNIFRIDENNNLVFEREVDLLKYANSHGYQNLILKRVDEIKYGNSNIILFPKWARPASYNPTGSAKAKEDSLAKFLFRARTQYGIDHIAASDKPYDDTLGNYKTNFFFYNIHNFNERQYSAHSNNNDYCFDMLYGEDDFWNSNGALGSNYQGNWSNYYLKGIRQIDSVKVLSQSTSYGTLLTGTYIGNLNKVTTSSSNSITNQMQADSIDRHLNWVFLDIYFRGFKINQVRQSDTTYEFFHDDKIMGRRMKLFANNAYPSVILPLFGSQASADTVNSDFFGNNLLNDNGLFFSQDKTEWQGTVNDVKSYFENLYNTVQNPYNDHIPGQSGLTMKELTEDSVTAGNIANTMTEGVGWFKYGTMPDNNVYLLKADTVGLDTAVTFTLKPDQLITNGTDSCIKCRGFNYNASSNAQIIARHWYEDGVLMPNETDSTLQVILIGGDTVIYTYEITVETPGAAGAFNELKLRTDMKVKKSLVIGNGCGWGPHWSATAYANPTCPSYTNGTVALDYVCSSCSPSNKTFKWFNSSNNIVLSQNSVTATGLSSGTYRVEMFCGTTYLSHTYVVLHDVDNSPHPAIYSDNYEINCYPSMHINSAYSGYSIQWYRNGTASGNAISGATGTNYTASQNGTYYVKVTQSGGCSGFSAPIVINYAPTPTISGSNITCLEASETNKTYTVIEDPNNATYSWTVPNGVTKTTNGNTMTITSWGSMAATGGPISCTVTNACGRSTTANYTVYGCCASASVGDLNNYSITSGTPTLTGTFNINGTLTISGSGTIVTLSSADVQLSKEAKIVVEAGAKLIVTSASHLRSCSTDMWTGIEILGNGIVELNSKSKLEDAIVGIDVLNNGTVTIDDATLNANYRHLKITGNGTLNASYIGNSAIFSCKNASNVNTNCLKAPYTSQRTLEAIQLNSIGSISIGDASNPAISLNNCGIGIYSSSSNLSVVKSDFSTVGKGTYAIYDGNLTVTDCNFDLCTTGIEDKYNVNLNASNNHFNNGTKGIYTSLGSTISIVIQNNNFLNMSQYSIQNIANQRCNYTISSNYIYSDTTDYDHGIEINGLLDGQPDNNSSASIYSNELYNIACGIHLQSIDGAQIYSNLHNEVKHTYSYDYQSYGIKVENCTGTRIDNNSVTSYDGTLDNIWWSNGIMADNSPYSEIQCNSVGNIGRGFWIGGASPHTLFGGNSMGNCYDQLYLNWNLLGLGDQGASVANNPPNGIALDNEWVGTTYTAGNGHQTNSNYSNEKNVNGFTLFHTRSGNPYAPTDNHVYPASSVYYACDVNIIPYNSSDSYCIERPELPEDRNVEQRIAQDSVNYESYHETFRWMSKQYLLKQSKMDTMLVANDVDMAAGVAAIEQSNVGQIEAMQDSIAAIEADSANLLKIVQLQQVNNGLQPGIVAESNYKTTHALCLHFAKNQAFTNGQKSSIIYLSELCPYAAGPAVYIARTLRQLFDSNPHRYLGCENYNPQPANRKAKTSKEGDSNLTYGLFPSPSDGNAVYQFNAPENVQLELKVFDYTGKLILSKNVSGTSKYEFKQLNLSDGVYRVQLFVEGQKQDEQNMVVVK